MHLKNKRFDEGGVEAKSSNLFEAKEIYSKRDREN